MKRVFRVLCRGGYIKGVTYKWKKVRGRWNLNVHDDEYMLVRI